MNTGVSASSTCTTTEGPAEGLTLSLIQKVMASLPEPEVIFYISSEYVPKRFSYYVIPRMDDAAKTDIVCHPTMVERLKDEFFPLLLRPLDAKEVERRTREMLNKRIAAMSGIWRAE